jgi:RNA polymerase primary sigma factor
MRFGIGEDEKHSGEIGAHLDMSGARGRQIENAALRRLRHPSRTKLLKDFVEDA